MLRLLEWCMKYNRSGKSRIGKKIVSVIIKIPLLYAKWLEKKHH